MPSLYVRGSRIYARLKHVKVAGKWGAVPTPYVDGQQQLAERWAAASQKELDRKHRIGGKTVADYARTWLIERKKRHLASYRDDAGRLNNHALPIIGHIPIAELKVRHLRDMVRKLEQDPDLAPRTILHIVNIVRTMLHDANRDELTTGAPWDLARHDLPQRSDKDPEWRELATYTLDEVVMLITDQRIPMVRRVQYALKALAGLRHGEIAGLRWSHWIKDEPLDALQVARSYQAKRTKTGVTRRVPIVPALGRVLRAWLVDQYDGAPANQSALIVSTRAGKMISAHYAHEAFKDDLKTLGLRDKAGQHRNRGGHDLRAWFITTCKQNGASGEDIARITHTKRGDVMSGYTRTNWAKLCEAASKVGIEP